jgi:hypothetical protein
MPSNQKPNRSVEDDRVALQRAAFDFLFDKYKSQEIFTREQFQKATGFSDVSFRTYLSKQFRGLLIEVDDKSYRVNLAFRQYSTWPKFRDNVVTQNRRLTRKYLPTCYPNVVTFEFFMPLRNEEYLRVALDALFFRDSIKTRLKTISDLGLKKQFPRNTGEGYDNYLERVCEWVASKFVGYSINHVTGRFRVGELKASDQVITGDRYLMDETTAVVRFIFACDPPSLVCPTDPALLSTAHEDELLEKEADLIRWFFKEMFVDSILEVVNGEDEIWLLEGGMRTQLFIYKVQE